MPIIFFRENSKNSPVNVLISEFGPERLAISRNGPPEIFFSLHISICHIRGRHSNREWMLLLHPRLLSTPCLTLFNRFETPVPLMQSLMLSNTKSSSQIKAVIRSRVRKLDVLGVFTAQQSTDPPFVVSRLITTSTPASVSTTSAMHKPVPPLSRNILPQNSKNNQNIVLSILSRPPKRRIRTAIEFTGAAAPKLQRCGRCQQHTIHNKRTCTESLG
jgi:hypothetical protein